MGRSIEGFNARRGLPGLRQRFSGEIEVARFNLAKATASLRRRRLEPPDEEDVKKILDRTRISSALHRLASHHNATHPEQPAEVAAEYGETIVGPTRRWATGVLHWLNLPEGDSSSSQGLVRSLVSVAAHVSITPPSEKHAVKVVEEISIGTERLDPNGIGMGVEWHPLRLEPGEEKLSLIRRIALAKRRLEDRMLDRGSNGGELDSGQTGQR